MTKIGKLDSNQAMVDGAGLKMCVRCKKRTTHKTGFWLHRGVKKFFRVYECQVCGETSNEGEVIPPN